MKKSGVIILFLVFALLFIPFSSAVSDLKLDSVILKISLKQGDTISKSITASSVNGGEFSVQVEGLEGVSPEEELFVLSPGDVHTFDVVFNSTDLVPGIYAGRIKLTDVVGDFKILPVVFEVESKDVFFDINLDVPPQYSSVSPGGKIVAQLRIFDLTGLNKETALGPSEIELEYIIKGLDGSLLNVENEKVVVDGQARVSKTIIIPKEAVPGDYLFIATAKYRSSLGTSSYLFSISDSNTEGLSFAGLDFRFISVLIVIVLFFLGIILLFVYLIHERDNLFLELKKYNSVELARQRELLLTQVQVVKGKRPTKEIKKEVQEKVTKLKKTQEKRVKKFKDLKRKGKTNDMSKMLSKWKKQGYNTMVLSSKLKGVGTSDMKKQMSKWKKQGYGIKKKK